MEEEYIPISHINNYISNLVKKTFADKLQVKGIVSNVSSKNDNFFFTLKSENDFQINGIF